jgi:hypothetical protein
LVRLRRETRVQAMEIEILKVEIEILKVYALARRERRASDTLRGLAN